jgi:hypothetical protein
MISEEKNQPVVAEIFDQIFEFDIAIKIFHVHHLFGDLFSFSNSRKAVKQLAIINHS